MIKQKDLILNIIIITLFSMLTGCEIVSHSSAHNAPVIDGWHQPARNQGSGYLVHAGDSLYSIAWAFDLDYREIAKHNGLKAPYHLKAGQRLNLALDSTHDNQQAKPGLTHRLASLITNKLPQFRKTNSTQTKQSTQITQTTKPKENIQPIPSQQHSQQQFVQTKNLHWRWPAKGKVLHYFSHKPPLNKGVDIAGYFGQAVYAAAPGIVVYSGRGLRGYGNLLIIKHNDNLLSAYAYNRKLIVKEGDWVKVGQKVAQMGHDAKQHAATLHFEIRRAGKPINPLSVLPKHIPKHST